MSYFGPPNPQVVENANECASVRKKLEEQSEYSVTKQREIDKLQQTITQLKENQTAEQGNRAEVARLQSENQRLTTRVATLEESLKNRAGKIPKFKTTAEKVGELETTNEVLKLQTAGVSVDNQEKNKSAIQSTSKELQSTKEEEEKEYKALETSE